MVMGSPSQPVVNGQRVPTNDEFAKMSPDQQNYWKHLVSQYDTDPTRKLLEDPFAMPKPPSAPDLTDKAVKAAGDFQVDQALRNRGRRSTFLANDVGPAAAPQAGLKTYLGG
jgi:hypothetical protein